MKIAILTQPLGHNYGGILQAWALQTILMRHGHTLVILNRRRKKKLSRSYIKKLMANLLRLMLRVNKLDHSTVHVDNLIELKTKNFLNKNILLSDEINSSEHLAAFIEGKKFDAVIVGSDQVWRPEYSPNIRDFSLYFLNDTNILKIAYAASFGVDYWPLNSSDTAVYARSLKQFDLISLREDTGVNLINDYLNIEAKHVLDPTMLLMLEDYKGLCQNEISFQDDHIYTYILDETSEKIDFINECQKYLNLKVISHHGDKLLKTSKIDEAAFNIYPSVEKWIAGFRDASFIITDSYHGAIFSIIFNKPFLVIENQDRGSARFHSLLRLFLLEDRLFQIGTKSLKVDSSIRKMRDTTDRLKELRQESLRILLDSLKDLQGTNDADNDTKIE